MIPYDSLRFPRQTARTSGTAILARGDVIEQQPFRPHFPGLPERRAAGSGAPQTQALQRASAGDPAGQAVSAEAKGGVVVHCQRTGIQRLVVTEVQPSLLQRRAARAGVGTVWLLLAVWCLPDLR